MKALVRVFFYMLGAIVVIGVLWLWFGGMPWYIWSKLEHRDGPGFPDSSWEFAGFWIGIQVGALAISVLIWTASKVAVWAFSKEGQQP